MTGETLFLTIGEIDARYVDGIAITKVIRAVPSRRARRLIAVAAAIAIAAGLTVTAYAGELDRRYNAAVVYLQSLGIEAEDLSDYSRAEIRAAADWFRTAEPAPADNTEKYLALYEKVYGKTEAPHARPTEPASVTSDDVRKLTPTMTVREVTDRLGPTIDVGSGVCILLYEVDGEYTLLIPFAGLDAQLGVTGEALLQALQPKEK